MLHRIASQRGGGPPLPVDRSDEAKHLAVLAARDPWSLVLGLAMLALLLVAGPAMVLQGLVGRRTISRELARGMGGELSVKSIPGSGSVFTFTLPLSEP